MPKVGDKEFPYTPEGMAAAKAESQNMGIPVNDGANRSVTEYAGGGKTGYSQIGMENPMMGHGGKMTPEMMKYEEGGKTNPLDQNGDGKISLYERNNPPKDPNEKARLKAKDKARRKKVKEGVEKTVKKVKKSLEDKNLIPTFKKNEKLAKKEKAAKAARAEKRAARKAARKAKREERKAYYAKERDAMKRKTELMKKSKGISKKAGDTFKKAKATGLKMPKIEMPKLGFTVGKSKK